jgi:hypothetical protein
MKKNNDLLDRLNISRPCGADWSQMRGDEQKRFCSECNKFVYDFSQMSRQEGERAVLASHDEMCARITRDAAGSIVTLESSLTTRITGGRASPLAAAVLLGVGATALAMTACTGKPATVSSINATDNIVATAQPSYVRPETIMGGAIPEAVPRLPVASRRVGQHRPRRRKASKS